jgi:hypothetical protein
MITKSQYRKLAEAGKLPAGFLPPDAIVRLWGVPFGRWYDAIMDSNRESTFENAITLFKTYCHQNGAIFRQPSQLLSERVSRNIWKLQNFAQFLAQVNTRTFKVNGFRLN